MGNTEELNAALHEAAHVIAELRMIIISRNEVPASHDPFIEAALLRSREACAKCMRLTEAYRTI
jgi:hypothetical protein